MYVCGRTWRETISYQSISINGKMIRVGAMKQMFITPPKKKSHPIRRSTRALVVVVDVFGREVLVGQGNIVCLAATSNQKGAGGGPRQGRLDLRRAR